MVFPVPTAAFRWTLLSVLAFAVIGMHSLVTTHTAGVSRGRLEMAGLPTEVASGPAEPAAGPMVDQVADETATDCCPDHDQGMNHSGRSGHGHDLLHLCLAVLVALAGLTLGWLLWQRGRPTARPHGPNPVVTHAGRGPPRGRPVNDLLSSLCVLRL